MKELKETVTKYQAQDDTIFNSKQECENYEVMWKLNNMGVTYSTSEYARLSFFQPGGLSNIFLCSSNTNDINYGESLFELTLYEFHDMICDNLNVSAIYIPSQEALDLINEKVLGTKALNPNSPMDYAELRVGLNTRLIFHNPCLEEWHFLGWLNENSIQDIGVKIFTHKLRMNDLEEKFK